MTRVAHAEYDGSRRPRWWVRVEGGRQRWKQHGGGDTLLEALQSACACNDDLRGSGAKHAEAVYRACERFLEENGYDAVQLRLKGVE